MLQTETLTRPVSGRATARTAGLRMRGHLPVRRFGGVRSPAPVAVISTLSPATTELLFSSGRNSMTGNAFQSRARPAGCRIPSGTFECQVAGGMLPEQLNACLEGMTSRNSRKMPTRHLQCRYSLYNLHTDWYALRWYVRGGRQFHPRKPVAESAWSQHRRSVFFHQEMVS